MLKLTLLFGLIPLVVSQESFQTVDDWAKDFFLAETESPEYEIVPIQLHSRQRRDGLSQRTSVNLIVFDQNVRLWLYPADAILAGDRTPIYEINCGGLSPYSQLIRRPGAMEKIFPQILEDPMHGASVSIRRNKRDELSMTGFIESQNLFVRPVPDELIDQVRSQRGLVEGEMNETNFHAVYKLSSQQNSTEIFENSLLALSRTKRMIRNTTPTPIIPNIVYPEILIYVDHPLYARFGSNLERAIAYLLPFWNGVDLKYRGFQNPKFRLNIAGMIYAKDNCALGYMKNNRNNNNQIDVDDALYQTQTWTIQNIRSMIPATQYDIAITMTTEPLCKMAVVNRVKTCQSQIYGLAYLGKACDSYSRNHAIVWDNAGFHGIHTAAHELGHLFGAYHDGELYPHNFQCPESDGCIMAKCPILTRRSSEWSTGSLAYFQNFLNSDKSHCLHNKPNVGLQYKANRNLDHQDIPLPGKYMSAKKQCEFLVGTGASVINENQKDICQELRCKDSRGVISSSSQAATGTSCGRAKICVHSNCVAE